jgi:hypothetical protein
MWTRDIIDILERIRFNSIKLNEQHTERYLKFASVLKYFDIPIIICSVFSSSFSSLGINPNYSQIITTVISMGITILSSIKLYLNLTNTISNEIDLSKSYYLLSIGIYKMLMLRPADTNPRLYLDNIFSEYSKLIEQSTIILKNSKKDLLTINNINTPEGSLQSKDSFNIITDENEL